MNNYTQLPKYTEMVQPSKDITVKSSEFLIVLSLSFGTGILLGLLLGKGLYD